MRRNRCSLPRKNLKKRPPSWQADIMVGEGRDHEEFEHRIYLGAYNGGMAKKKALPKIQTFLEQSLQGYVGSPRVHVLLKKISVNGGNGAPSYVLREGYSHFKRIISTHKPSRVFKVANGES